MLKFLIPGLQTSLSKATGWLPSPTVLALLTYSLSITNSQAPTIPLLFCHTNLSCYSSSPACPLVTLRSTNLQKSIGDVCHMLYETLLRAKVTASGYKLPDYS